MLKSYSFELEMVVSEDENTDIRKHFRSNLSFFSVEDVRLSVIDSFVNSIREAIKAAILFKQTYSEVKFSASVSIIGDNVAFRRWYADDIDCVTDYATEESLYLSPDTQYNSENHDMVIELKNPLEGLTC